ncbi:hypothetical protein MNEG_12029 [Monoraphidium neglectum]|uniref:Uncharacterized protein n=1 Tax=Monoraphidium neglectum TaxID=145388 RepID=A0A0D2J829_9CHLO|nr:hypothetical protein MNEG_12029 [Monoraphidium neglectum]KIY95932.1 hypothetical protein MNEG_12029 [Monoraphidium neglectum]|eukprot:XP_013894952.1 hypothetical protein MNEG_12029 [Monoraphidium neglectum]
MLTADAKALAQALAVAELQLRGPAMPEFRAGPVTPAHAAAAAGSTSGELAADDLLHLLSQHLPSIQHQLQARQHSQHLQQHQQSLPVEPAAPSAPMLLPPASQPQNAAAAVGLGLSANLARLLAGDQLEALLSVAAQLPPQQHQHQQRQNQHSAAQRSLLSAAAPALSAAPSLLLAAGMPAAASAHPHDDGVVALALQARLLLVQQQAQQHAQQHALEQQALELELARQRRQHIARLQLQQLEAASQLTQLGLGPLATAAPPVAAPAVNASDAAAAAGTVGGRDGSGGDDGYSTGVSVRGACVDPES